MSADPDYIRDEIVILIRKLVDLDATPQLEHVQTEIDYALIAMADDE